MNGLNRAARVFCVLLITILFAACGSRQPQIGFNEMKKIMWEMAQAEAFATYYVARDSTANVEKEMMKKYAEVLAAHKTDEKTFFASLDYYRNNPEKFRVLLDSLNAYSNRMREQMYMKQ
jgi:hypothetical protein